MAHAAAVTDSPAGQGCLGICEVFVDTVLLCTVTALTILVSDSGPSAFGEDGVRTAQAAFTSVLGRWSGGVFALAVLLFAAATIFCWAHYGATCLRALVPTCGTGLYAIFTLTFCASLLLGSGAAPALCWTLADSAIAGMTVLNLAFLLLLRREVTEESKKLWET